MNVTYTNMLTVEAYNALHKSVGWDTRKPERVQMALDRADFLSAAYKVKVDDDVSFAFDRAEEIVLDSSYPCCRVRQGCGMVHRDHGEPYRQDKQRRDLCGV